MKECCFLDFDLDAQYWVISKAVWVKLFISSSKGNKLISSVSLVGTPPLLIGVLIHYGLIFWPCFERLSNISTCFLTDQCQMEFDVRKRRCWKQHQKEWFAGMSWPERLFRNSIAIAQQIIAMSSSKPWQSNSVAAALKSQQETPRPGEFSLATVASDPKHPNRCQHVTQKQKPSGEYWRFRIASSSPFLSFVSQEVSSCDSHRRHTIFRSRLFGKEQWWNEQ